MNWLKQNWPASTIFLAIYITIMLILFVRDDYPLLLIWAQLPVYFLHEFEEYILPGGFVKWFNRRVLGSFRDDWPMTPLVTLWINVPIIFTAFPIGAILATEIDIKYGLWMAYFSVINASSHVVLALIFRGYNPGLVVSVLLNIPVGIYAITYLSSHGLVSTTANVASLLIGIAIQAAVMFWGFAILKPRVHAAANARCEVSG